MSAPLSFLRNDVTLPAGTSLGEFLSERITDSDAVHTLVHCLCSTSEPAIHSTDSSTPPLRHDALRSFVSNFVLPHSHARQPLGPNDRVMVVLPTGPENALALLAVASYHTCAPMNASCTASELKDDAVRLNAKAVVTTRDAEERLELQQLQNDLGCEIIYIEGRSSGPAGIFDMDVMGDVFFEIPLRPSRLHGLDDRSLILHTSGTSGKKKVVPYTLRSLIVGTCAVVHSWDLQRHDINRECTISLVCSRKSERFSVNMMPLFHVGGIVRNLLAVRVEANSCNFPSNILPNSLCSLVVAL